MQTDWAMSDQTSRSVASDSGLQCLPNILLSDLSIFSIDAYGLYMNKINILI